jgi:hypothetical protein
LAHGLNQSPAALHGTLVYAPHPSGAAAALQNIAAGGVPSGIVLDATGNLYLSERPAPGDPGERVSIRVFADPVTAPRFTRRIGGKSFGFPLVTSGLAIDSAGELYVVDMRVQPPLGNTSTFSAYPSTANGSIKADRTIVPPAADLAYGAIGLATTGGHLFATFGPTTLASGGASGIYEYATSANGKTAPLQTLAAPQGTIVEAVAVGP